MITCNPEHKKATLQKLVKAGKTVLSVSLAGVVSTVTLFIYSNIIKEHQIKVVDDMGRTYTTTTNSIDLITNEETLFKDLIINNYEKNLTEEKKEEKPKNLIYAANKQDSDVVNINSSFKSSILRSLNKEEDPECVITVGDLKQIQELDWINEIDIYDDSDISWLNYCENLYKLSIEFQNPGAEECLKQIKSLPNLNRLEVKANQRRYTGQALSVDEDYFGFLNNCPNLNVLKLDSTIFSLNSEFLQKWIETKNGIAHLSLLNFGVRSQNVDINKLMNFYTLEIFPDSGNGKYDIPLIFSREDFNKLFKSNMEIRVDTVGYKLDEYIDEVNRIYDMVDNIVKEIHIDEKASNKEKLNIILEYVLKNLSYNEDSAKIQEEEGVEANIFGQQPEALVEETKKSYQDGYLYGILDENGKVICGNYAALMEILLNRFGVEAYTVGSEYHAYNLVKVDNEYFYVDATYLDQLTSDVVDMDIIIENDAHLILPQIHSDVYDTLITPVEAEIKEEFDVEKRVDQLIYDAKKEYVIKFNNQLIMVSAAVLFGILSAVGLAKSTNKLNRLEELEELKKLDKEELRNRLLWLKRELEAVKLANEEKKRLGKLLLSHSSKAEIRSIEGEIQETRELLDEENISRR
ncbi:MAG: hypothetical protein IJN03_01625 [Bacilli bacterium]|nr:hypothetical protein [Bacilli bacterium]